MTAYLGVLLTAFVFGVRHGIDWDHIAAISDITSSEPHKRRSVVLATLYAGGHGIVVFAIGAIAVTSGAVAHPGLDRVMEKIVGLTLVLMGVYVIDSLVRRRSGFRMQSRWMLLLALCKRLVQKARGATNVRRIVVRHEHHHVHAGGDGHEHRHPHLHGHASFLHTDRSTETSHAHSHEHEHALEPSPDSVFASYSPRTAVLVGMLHAVGAETPTQVLLFVSAAGIAGRAAGLAMVGAFVAGVLASNTAIALGTAAGFDRAKRGSRPYYAFAGVTAAFSLVTGTIFLSGAHLPSLLGG
ncbi:MAG: hypothetical protein M3290_09355 [Actinomycetota bacterium]|nr:hypothetical protein [Actinomycetota bacterium]